MIIGGAGEMAKFVRVLSVQVWGPELESSTLMLKKKKCGWDNAHLQSQSYLRGKDRKIPVAYWLLA